MDKKWISSGWNYVLSGEDFYISYNPQPMMSNEPETALALSDPDDWRGRTFLILSGDWRRQYEEAFPSLEKCLEVYHQNIQHRCWWSEDEPTGRTN